MVLRSKQSEDDMESQPPRALATVLTDLYIFSITVSIKAPGTRLILTLYISARHFLGYYIQLMIIHAETRTSPFFRTKSIDDVQ